MKKKLLMLIPLTIFFVLVAFFIKDIVEIWPYIFNGNEEVSEVLLESFGWKGVIYLIIIQACQMLLVFIPSEFIQIISGATYGVFFGTLVCWGGLILGATIIYLLVNVFKVNVETIKEGSDNDEIIKSLNKKRASAFRITLILYFLPAIPYGIICYFASGTKLNYFKYILACLIGVLPSVLIDSLLGTVAINLMGKYLWPILLGFVAFMLFFLWLVKKFSKRQLNKALYNSPNPEIEVVLNKKKYTDPNNKFTKKTFKLVTWFFKKKNNITCDDNIKNFEPPYIVLCSHLSKPDFVYVKMALGDKNIPNIVANRYYFNNPIIFNMFDKAGVIPKKMFTSDINCIKQIMKVIKSGNSCAMMPDGRLSINGTNPRMPGGLGKLLKKLNVPVLGVIPHGAYFTGAKWMTTRHKGKINIETKVILTQEQVEQLEAEEIEKICQKSLKYDDFEWIKESKVNYKSKNMLKGIDGILYHCPNCDSEFTIRGKKNKIICSHCHHETIMDNQFSFINPPIDNIKNIRDWYDYQIKLEQKNIKKEDFKLSCDVVAKTYQKHGKGMVKIGKGTCNLTKDGIQFTCTDNEKENAHISCEYLQCLLFGCNEDFETYIDDKFYFFVPLKQKQICTKFAICSEALHDHLAKNNKQN